MEKEILGLDECELGEQFQEMLANTECATPWHLVICTKESSPSILKAAEKYVEVGVEVTLVHDRREAPLGTRWLGKEDQ